MTEEQLKTLENKIKLADRCTYFVKDENAKEALLMLKDAILMLAKEVRV